MGTSDRVSDGSGSGPAQGRIAQAHPPLESADKLAAAPRGTPARPLEQGRAAQGRGCVDGTTRSPEAGRSSRAAGQGPSPPALGEPGAVELQELPRRQLHPLPRGLVELYGLLAVLVVLVPEWMASGALFGFREARRGSELPLPSSAWQRLPELRLAGLELAGLRRLAQQQGLRGYAGLNRRELTMRLLRQLKKQA